MNIIFLIFQFIILIFSVIVHEVSHGSAAHFLGDDTAKSQDRLSLNPARHFDLWGSFLIPVMLFIATAGNIIFGWAKPVPYNPFALKNPKRDSGLIALAGPLSNILVAIIFGVAIRLVVSFNIFSLADFVFWFDLIVQINLVLAIFNLIPIPPLDGAGILFSLLPKTAEKFFHSVSRYGLLILLMFILFGFQIIYPIISFLHRLIVGL